MLNGISDRETPSKRAEPHEALSTYGALSLLASQCPLHSTFLQKTLNKIFLPAIEHNSVRIFWTTDKKPCAALIWARLSDEVSQRMVTENRTPNPSEWNSGDHLWFLDLIAPFGHGKDIARHFARKPPNEAFSFARIGPDGRLRKVVNVPKAGSANRPFHATFATERRQN